MRTLKADLGRKLRAPSVSSRRRVVAAFLSVWAHAKAIQVSVGIVTTTATSRKHTAAAVNLCIGVCVRIILVAIVGVSSSSVSAVVVMGGFSG